MTRIWDDRLAEVWAAPGKAGAGVVIGAATVLTAGHMVAGARSDGRVLARVVQRDGQAASWVPMVVSAFDPDWDVALLRPSGEEPGDAGTWREPVSRSPTIVRLGTAAEYQCESVGFPQSEVQQAPEDRPVSTIRQTEQVSGTLFPAGQSKTPVNAERKLPLRWMPLDVDGAVPGGQSGWAGMSGAGVVLPDGRLAGLVTTAEAGHQQRRLYVIPLADVLAQSPQVAEGISLALGSPAVVEARSAPRFRDTLLRQCLGPDGMPVRVGEASLSAFGVESAGIPGEAPFLDYVPRDGDRNLRLALQTARDEQRILLVVGGSAAGKSRSAAEAARESLGGRLLLCPRQTRLAQLQELDLADFGSALVWLDDAERYDSPAFRDAIEWLLHEGAVVVATIRRTELEKIRPLGLKNDLRNPLGDTLSDKRLVVQVAWPIAWNEQERARFAQLIRYPTLLAWVASGKSPGSWVVAGPALEERLHDAEADDERPARYALVRTALDWYRTGIAKPIPKVDALSLLESRFEPTDIDDAWRWASESVLGASRSTSQSLLAETPAGDAAVHDFIQDADARNRPPNVPDPVWTLALKYSTTDQESSAVGYAAAVQGNAVIAAKAWTPLATKGDSRAMLNLGALLKDSDPEQARHWFEQAVAAGDSMGMVGLGTLLRDSDPAEARRCFDQAAAAGQPEGMVGLGDLLRDSNPANLGSAVMCPPSERKIGMDLQERQKAQ